MQKPVLADPKDQLFESTGLRKFGPVKRELVCLRMVVRRPIFCWKIYRLGTVIVEMLGIQAR